MKGCVLFLLATLAAAAEPHLLTVDFSNPQGALRALHGINKGPLAANGLIDVTEAHKRLRLPSTRLHDCHHPNPDVVDIHTIFPNPGADPALVASFDFRATDEYVAAVRATGAEIVFRLGESIEHQTVKRHVHPPRDAARLAAVCAGIVRHYNEGWASGHHYGIRYWEVWNEPENRPVMWTGTDAQFLELYAVAARTLRAEFPTLKIGGAGFGYYGKFDGTTLMPSEFVTAFLNLCRRESLPLDFFSWHCYTDDPAELVARACAVRRLLDQSGFSKTESHLNECSSPISAAPTKCGSPAPTCHGPARVPSKSASWTPSGRSNPSPSRPAPKSPSGSRRPRSRSSRCVQRPSEGEFINRHRDIGDGGTVGPHRLCDASRGHWQRRRHVVVSGPWRAVRL